MNKEPIAIFATGLALTESAMAAGVNGRESNQKQRITNGLKSGGGLNVREASKLLNAQVRIRNDERKFRNSGGGLNANERTQLQNQLDVQSARIKLLRHN